MENLEQKIEGCTVDKSKVVDAIVDIGPASDVGPDKELGSSGRGSGSPAVIRSAEKDGPERADFETPPAPSPEASASEAGRNPGKCKACGMDVDADQTSLHECPLESMRPGPEGQPSKSATNEDETFESSNTITPKNNSGDGDSLKQCKFYRLGCKFVGNRFELDLHMDIGSETHLDIVCKSIQEIKSEYIKKENKIITKHENKIKMLQDYICKQNVIIKDLHQTNRGLETSTRMLQGKLKDVAVQSDLLLDQINNLKHSNNVFQEELREIRETSYNGSLLWKVTGVSDRMQRAALNTELSVYSPPFYTSRYGYKLRAQLFLNGHGSHTGEYVSLYFHILPTDHDDVLKWPFTHKITFSLLEQDKETTKGRQTADIETLSNISYTLLPSHDDDNFRRPKEKMSGGQGKSEFVSLNQLYKGAYIKNDCLFIKVRVHCKKDS